MRTRLKNLETGKVIDVTFKAGVDKVGIPDLSFVEMQYLYTDGSIYHFMDTSSFDQVTLKVEEVGDSKYYMKENSVVRVTFYKGRPVSIDVENFSSSRSGRHNQTFAGTPLLEVGSPQLWKRD